MENGVYKEENAFMNGAIDFQRAYWSQEIADILEIKTSTLRRWSIDLEKAGYKFYRDDHNRRSYFERDIEPLKKLKELLNNKVRMDDAIDIVIATFSHEYSNVCTLPVHRGKQRDLEEIIRESVRKAVNEVSERQEAINKELLIKLQQQQDYIRCSLEERDRQLMSALKESLEIKKQLASAQEQKKWWRFWV